MVRTIVISFASAIFFAAIAFSLQDGWIFTVSRFLTLASSMTFICAFFVGLIPSKMIARPKNPLKVFGRHLAQQAVGRRVLKIKARDELLSERVQNPTQWNLRYSKIIRSQGKV